MKMDSEYLGKLSVFAKGVEGDKYIMTRILKNPEQVINSNLDNNDLEFPEMVRDVYNAIAPFKSEYDDDTFSAKRNALDQLALLTLLMATQGSGVAQAAVEQLRKNQ